MGSGASPGKYFYTKYHLGSVRELLDESGNGRGRYVYEPYGGRTRITGDLDADFGFTGHFYHQRTDLDLPLYRPYDPRLGRWLSRDPLPDAEELLGPNLYAYARSDPANYIDPAGRFFLDPLTFGYINTFLWLGDLVGDQFRDPPPSPGSPREPATPREPLVKCHRDKAPGRPKKPKPKPTPNRPKEVYPSALDPEPPLQPYR